MREMRSSVIFLGALLARIGTAELSYPGGCELGPRPIDLHLTALRQMGLTIDEKANDTRSEARISIAGSKVDVWVIPTNEEILIARDTVELSGLK